MKYTLYTWSTDDDGGYGICPVSEFTPNKEHNQVKIGDFNTTSELADLLYADDPDWFVDEPGAFMEAINMMRDYAER